MQTWPAILTLAVTCSPGWDSRPWYGDRAMVRTNPRPEKFRVMCENAKRYVDPELQAVISECWNEFGEGSYIEPTTQYGFGYLDAIRDAFCPRNPDHVDLTPPQPFTTCPAGEAVATLPAVTEPRALQLQATLTDGARTVTNAWDLWLFPDKAPLALNAVRLRGVGETWLAKWDELPEASGEWSTDTVLLTDGLDEAALDFLHAGGKVILAAGEALVRPHAPNFGYVQYFFTPPANYGPYEDGQNGTVIADHPLLGGLPHAGFASWPFFRLIETAPPLDLAPLGLDNEDPVVRVIHRYPVLHPLGYLVERSVGAGRLVVTAFQLDPAWPEARYLLQAMSAYLLRSDLAPASPARPLTLERLLAAARDLPPA